MRRVFTKITKLQVPDPFRHLFGMVDKQLPVIHARKHLDVCVRVELAKVPGLRLGYKGLLGAIPIVDVGSVDGVKALPLPEGHTFLHSSSRTSK